MVISLCDLPNDFSCVAKAFGCPITETMFSTGARLLQQEPNRPFFCVYLGAEISFICELRKG